MILSESYDGFVARRKARELAGSWFDTEVLKRHLLVAKLNKVGGNKNSSEYTSYLINIAAKVMSSSMHACFCIQPGIDMKNVEPHLKPISPWGLRSRPPLKIHIPCCKKTQVEGLESKAEQWRDKPQ